MARRMRPYGQTKRATGIHPHNECGMCCAGAMSNGSKRMKLKVELNKDINDIPYHSIDE